MFIDRINLNQLRVFECVYRTKSMTVASRELHLTQSGVSQHIKTLESGLDVKLFDRLNHKLVPTTQGQMLYQKCSKGLREIENALWDAKGHEDELRGTVSIGMPIEFGINILLPYLSKFAKIHPLLKYKIELNFANVINEMLLSGHLDFAFVDDFQMDSQIETESVFEETVELCIRKDLVENQMSFDKRFLENLDFIAYQNGEPVLRNWFQHHYQSRNQNLNVRATVMDVQAMSKLIIQGLGAGILPGYVVEKLISEGAPIYCFKGEKGPLINNIRMARLSGRTLSNSTKELMQYLKSSLVD